jgi:hypothetical protein
LGIELISRFLNNLLYLTQKLHQIYHPSFRATVPNNYQGIYDVDEVLVGQLLGKAETTFKPDSHLKSVRYWLETARELCYGIAGLFCKQRTIYDTPNFASMIQQSLFAHLEHVETRHYKLLLRIFAHLSQFMDSLTTF